MIGRIFASKSSFRKLAAPSGVKDFGVPTLRCSGVGRSFRRFSSTAADASSAIQDAHNRKIGYWLLGVAGLVAGMVSVGGVTRLTRSGLSMVDWKLQGSLPPMNAEEWEKEFDNYKKFPEWQQRKSMTIDEFKYIYFWEYGHRMMGRFIGVAFTGPFLYFALRGMIPKQMYGRLAGLFTLGGTQGLIGWWMVKSGLEMDPAQKKEIRVSPYRLTTHLAMAFTTYSLLVWTGLGMLNSGEKFVAAASKLSTEVLQQSRKLRRLAIFNGLLVATTVLSGAFVAGNDAGRAFNTFPKMGDNWIPEEILSYSPMWTNFFENTATVQFDHRVLALTTLASIGHMYGKAKNTLGGTFWSSIPRNSRLAFNTVAGLGVAQVGLGISTLLLYVPIPLAAAHQAGSLALLTSITYLSHTLKYSTISASSISGPAAARAATVATTAAATYKIASDYSLKE
jgi:cytochrome c oxidase assembly protein subunit 15